MILTVTLNPALDKTVYIPDFAVDRVNRIQKIHLDPGGKGINVCKAVNALGGKSLALGILGGGTGRYIKDRLDELGVENEFLFIDGDTRTNLKVVDEKNRTYTDLNEPGPTVDAAVISALGEKLFARVGEGDIVVFAGGAPRGVPDELFRVWTERCKALGACVYADLDGVLLAKTVEAAPYLVKPNDTELSRLLGRPMETTEDLISGAKELTARGVRLAAVSLGAKGALFCKDGELFMAEGLKVDVRSTVGAGDSMLAALAWCQDRGLDWKEAARWAVATASAKVTEEGSSPPRLEKVREFYSRVICHGV